MYADDRTARQLNNAARKLEKLARGSEADSKACQASGSQAQRAFADGAAYAFRRSAKFLKASAKGKAQP